IPLWPERELRGAGGCEELQELEVDPDQLVPTALRQRHPSFANLSVAGPRVDGAGSRRRALEGLLHRRIELRPRVPRFPLVEVVHLRKDGGRRGGDGSRSGDAVLGWPGGNDGKEHGERHRERDADLYERRDCLRRRPKATNAARSATTSSIRATATIPPTSVITVAPIMMITSPAAASGVRPGRMRRSPGRIRPSAPSTSATPRNLKNQPGSATGPVIWSSGRTSFAPPANRKRAAS